ncbi:MAG: ATP-binding protein [Planctomycetes bacterium]|nr:ATP-binding protein [Planctomycetota bacterium]
MDHDSVASPPTARAERQLGSGLALFIAVGTSLLLATSAGLTMKFASERTGELAARERRVHATTAEIRYLDEVLTMSANMAAATGEARWKRRYDAHVERLDRAIKELRAVAPLLFDREVGQDTDAANVRLVAMESRAFDLVDANRSADARAILDGAEYARDKELYAEGNRRAQQALIEWAAEANASVERWVAALAALSAGLGIVTAIAWVLFSRATRDERARLELEHERERRHAEEAANRAKSQFIAHMSHELRTPLTAILGYADLLRENDSDAETERRIAAETIHRNGDHLLAIINDILDVSKIEAGAMTVESVEVDLVELVHDVVELLGGRAKAKGIDLVREWASPVPRRVSTDPLRLRQILINLLGNAIKFTERGRVRLRVEWKPGAGQKGWLSCEIEDSGIGMTPEQLAKLFKPFAQADGSMSRRFGGTGLGLTISRRLAELLGGEITVKSEPGRGSSFTCRVPVGSDSHEPLCTPDAALPRARRDDGDAPPLGSVDAATTSEALAAADVSRPLLGARILLAEDGRDNQRLISLMLRRAGAHVTVVDDGYAALAELEAQGELGASPVSSRFDLVLMDMQMPELDGYRATERLRATGSTLPVIALTANTMEGDRERCLAAGCSGYLSKPIDRQALLTECSTRIYASTPQPK